MGSEMCIRDRSNQARTIVDMVNQSTSPPVSESTRASSNKPVAVCSLRASRPRVCFKVVPVKITCEGGNKQIATCAFLDGGSDATFCLESLVQWLGLKDIRSTSFTMTTANLAEERSGYEVQLNIESLEGDAKFQISNFLTTPNLPITRQHVGTEEDLRRWPHFYDVSLPDTGDGRVTILIGSERRDIIDKQLDKRQGQHGEPITIKTLLGWTVYGPVGDVAESRVNVNFTRTEEERLNAQLEHMYHEEFN